MFCKPQKSILTLGFTLALLLPAVANSAEAEENPEPAISFVEVMPNPEGTDSKENEYFKLKNNTGKTQDLTGYKVCNINNDCWATKGEILASGCLKIYRADFNFSLHNDKEILSLYDSNGNVIHKITIGTAPSGKAWLCGESFCEWGNPRDSCEYSDVVDPASEDEEDASSEDTLPQNDNANDNGDSPPTNEDETTNTNNSEVASLQSNSNLNTGNDTNLNINANKKKEKSFEIASAEDWQKVKKEMNRKNLLSLPTNIQGKISVPYNIVKSNAFSVLSYGKLVQIDIYVSRQSEFTENPYLYEEGTQVEIENGFLKNNQGTWQMGIGKGTELKITQDKKQKLAKMNLKSASANKIDYRNILRDEGKFIKISGEILKKSGQNFYVANKKDSNQVTNVFIPAIVWSKYLDRQNIGLFPMVKDGSLKKPGQYKGKTIEAFGAVEISENSYRILVTKAENFLIKDPFSSEKLVLKIDSAVSVKPPANPENKNGNDNKEDNNGNETVSANLTSEPISSEPSVNRNNNNSGYNPRQQDNLQASAGTEKSKIKNTLARSLSWKNLVGIVFSKLTGSIDTLRQYF